MTHIVLLHVVILTPTDTDVQFKLKLKKNLTLIISGKHVLHLLENTKYIHGKNYPYTNHVCGTTTNQEQF